MAIENKKFDGSFHLHEATGKESTDKKITRYPLVCVYCGSKNVVLRDFHISNVDQFGLDFYCKDCDSGFFKHHDAKLVLTNVYQSREFCKAIECIHQMKIESDKGDKVYCTEWCMAYRFHHWLEKNDFQIIKVKKRK